MLCRAQQLNREIIICCMLSETADSQRATIAVREERGSLEDAYRRHR